MNARKPLEPLIIDVEASGFSSESYPIEVGVAFQDGQRYCSLILPEPDWTHWDEQAEQVHGITLEVLHNCGQSAQIVANELNKMLDGKTLFSDGWVVDYPWLITLFHAAQREMSFRVSPLELILSETQMALWHDARESVIAEAKLTRHRASNDAWIIQQTYKQTLDQNNKKDVIVN